MISDKVLFLPIIMMIILLPDDMWRWDAVQLRDGWGTCAYFILNYIPNALHALARSPREGASMGSR